MLNDIRCQMTASRSAKGMANKIRTRKSTPTNLAQDRRIYDKENRTDTKEIPHERATDANRGVSRPKREAEELDSCTRDPLAQLHVKIRHRRNMAKPTLSHMGA